MTYRLNVPPGWPPPPPGWTPPPGWEPDPTWPPPPLGWQLWIRERDPGRIRRHPVLVAIGTTVLVLWIISALFGGGEPTARTVGAAPSASPTEQTVTGPTPVVTPTVEQPPPPPGQVLSLEVARVLGKGNRSVPRLLGVDYGTDQAATVEWSINDNLTAGLTKDSARRDVLDIIGAVKRSGVPVSSLAVRGNYELVDAYGNASERRVITAIYSAETIGKINVENVDYKRILDLMDAGFVRPAFRY